jgi:hypothetical protein
VDEKRFLDWAIAGHDGGIMVDGPLAVIAAPGGGIYGHHLLDLLPRMAVIRRVCDSGKRVGDVLREAIARPVVLSAGEHGFLCKIARDHETPLNVLQPQEAAGRATPGQFPSTDPDGNGRWIVAERVLLPLSTRYGPWHFDGEIMEQAFGQLAEIFSHEEPAEAGPLGATHKFIHLSRRHTNNPNRPPAGNYSELEAVLEGLGFHTVYPERLPMVQQTRLIRNAQVVLGEDGSALHGILHARGNESHLVMLPDPLRANFLHLPFAGFAGATLHICDGAIHPQPRSFSLPRITAFLRKVLASIAG